MKKLEFQDYDIVCFMQDTFSATAAAEAAARFPDLQFRVFEGTGIHEAIDYAKSSHHAKVICVDCSDLDLMISQVEPLMDYCPPDTNVIIVGMKNDVGVFRDLVRLHVSDYLVKPLNTDFIQRSLSNSLNLNQKDNQDRTKRTGKVVLFVSAVGGGGATTIATNASHYLANSLGKKVVLVDGDLLFGNVSRLLDLKPSHALFEMLESPDRLDEVLLEQSLVTYGDRLNVIASEEPLNELSMLDPGLVADNFNKLIDALIEKFHYVILDMPKESPIVWRNIYVRSDVAFIVSPLTLAGLQDTIRIGGALREDRSEATPRIVVNCPSQNSTMSIKEFEDNLGRQVNVIVPYESQAVSCSDAGTPIVDEVPKYREAISILIETISNSASRKESDGIINKILKSLKR